MTQPATPPAPKAPRTITPSPANGQLTQWLAGFASPAGAWSVCNEASMLFAFLLAQTDQVQERQRLAGLLPKLFTPMVTMANVPNAGLLTATQNLLTAIATFAGGGSSAEISKQAAALDIAMQGDQSSPLQTCVVGGVKNLAMGLVVIDGGFYGACACSALHSARVLVNTATKGPAAWVQLITDLRATVPFVSFVG